MKVFIRYVGLLTGVIIFSSCATLYRQALDAEKKGDLLSAYTTIAEAYKKEPKNEDLKKAYDDIKIKLTKSYVDLASNENNFNLFERKDFLKKTCELFPENADVQKINQKIDNDIEHVSQIAKAAVSEPDPFQRVVKFVEIIKYEPFFDDVKSLKKRVISENQQLIEYFTQKAVPGSESKFICLIDYVQKTLPDIKGLGDVRAGLLRQYSVQADDLSRKYNSVPNDRRKSTALFYSLIGSKYSLDESILKDWQKSFNIPMLAVTFNDGFSSKQSELILQKLENQAGKEIIKSVQIKKLNENIPINGVRILLSLRDLSSEPSSSGGSYYSKYQSGQQYISNPDYERAVLQYNTAMQNLQNAQQQEAGNLYGGFVVGLAQGNLNRARNVLSNTPSQISVPMYQDYQYQKVNIEYKLSFKCGYKIFDDLGNLLVSSEFTEDQVHKTEGIAGAHPQDSNYIKNKIADDSNDVLIKFTENSFQKFANTIIGQEIVQKDYYLAMDAAKNNDLGEALEKYLSWNITFLLFQKIGSEISSGDLLKELKVADLEMGVADPKGCESVDLSVTNLVTNTLKDTGKPALDILFLKYDPVKFYQVQERRKKSEELNQIITKNSDKHSATMEPPQEAFIDTSLEAVVTIKTPEATGSGFFISPDGYIVTNYHVIADSSDRQVILKDGKTLHADIVSIVKFKDLALLKVNGNGFKSLVLGNIQQAHAGDNVFALGSPGGVFGVLTNTVTRGVVSSVRMMDAPYNANEKIQFVQTDAAINPGNSGGPLINQKGEVLGVNSQKYSKAGIEGLNFAISVEEVKKSFADNIK